MTSLLSVFVPLACAGLAFALSPFRGASSATVPPVPARASISAPCTGCVASKDQDLKWLDVHCDCDPGSSTYFGWLQWSNEQIHHGSCSGWFECTDAAGCSWSYDLELIVDPDRPEGCFDDGVYAEKTGWPTRLHILNYDFGTLTSSAANCDESGPKTGNQVYVGI